MIVALGEPMVEFNQARADAPEHYVRGFGGDTSNMVIAAARLGARAGYVTRVGDDAFGRMLVDLWRAEEVDTRGVAIDSGAPTGVYFVTHGMRGHEFAYLRTGSAASRIDAATLPLDVIRGARVLHVSGISQAISTNACDAVLAAVEAAAAAGARISYDPNLRLPLWPGADAARAGLLLGLEQAALVKVSEEELAFMTGASDEAFSRSRTLSSPSSAPNSISFSSKPSITSSYETAFS